MAKAKKAKQLSKTQVKQVKKLIDRAKVFGAIDTSDSSAIITTPVYTLLTNIGQCDAINQRDSDKVQLKSVKFGFHAVGGASTASRYATMIRYTIFQWHDDSTPSGAVGAETGPYAGAGSANTTLSNWNIVGAKGKYSIVMDGRIRLADVDTGSGQMNVVENKSFKTVKFRIPKYAFYNGASSNKGQLYLALYTDATSNVPTINWTTRVRFIEA